MALDFLSPVSGKILDFANRLSSQHLGSKIVFHTKDDFPDLKKEDILACLEFAEHRERTTVRLPYDAA